MFHSRASGPLRGPLAQDERSVANEDHPNGADRVETWLQSPAPFHIAQQELRLTRRERRLVW